MHEPAISTRIPAGSKGLPSVPDRQQATLHSLGNTRKSEFRSLRLVFSDPHFDRKWPPRQAKACTPTPPRAASGWSPVFRLFLIRPPRSRVGLQEWCNSFDWTLANQALTIRKVQKVVQKWFPNLWAVERAPQPVGGLGRRRFKPAEGRTTKNTNHTNRDQAGKFPGVRTEAKEEHEEREPLM